MKKRNTLKNRKKPSYFKSFLLPLAIIILVIDTGIVVGFKTGLVSAQSAQDTTVQTIAAKPISSEISAEGTITAQSQATLHFQTGGKLVSLPLKEGDKVTQGQMIAQLDSYALQKQLLLAANAYETTKNTTDQTLENQKASVLEGQQRTSLDTANKNSYNSITEAQVITDAVQRIVDNSLLTQNSAQLNVDLANYAVQLSTLTSPLTGIITQEDVDVSGVNITPTTGFTVADPSTLVFRTTVLESDIDYVSEGSPAKINVNGAQQTISGTVSKIYPGKITMVNGESGYRVDIQSDQITAKNKFDQSGTALIQSNTQSNVLLVPAWTVLGGKYVWVKENNTPILKTITIGKMHDNQIEVTSGLSAGDKIITDPEFLSRQKYSLL